MENPRLLSFSPYVQASQSYELSRLQSLLQIQSRAAALMLVREDPGILELSPAFIMQRLVDLKVQSTLLCQCSCTRWGFGDIP